MVIQSLEPETQWQELNIDTVTEAARRIVQFFSTSQGFIQEIWSARTPRWMNDDQYYGRVTRELVRVMPPWNETSARSTDCWLTIGWSHFVAVPCFRADYEQTTFWRFAEGWLFFSVYHGDTLMFQRRILPTR